MGRLHPSQNAYNPPPHPSPTWGFYSRLLHGNSHCKHGLHFLPDCPQMASSHSGPGNPPPVSSLTVRMGWMQPLGTAPKQASASCHLPSAKVLRPGPPDMLTASTLVRQLAQRKLRPVTSSFFVSVEGRPPSPKPVSQPQEVLIACLPNLYNYRLWPQPHHPHQLSASQFDSTESSKSSEVLTFLQSWQARVAGSGRKILHPRF